MIRYRYNSQVVPPAPFVHVTVACLESAAEITDEPAQVDSGADRTVIPQRHVDELRLVKLDEILVAGFGGQVVSLPPIVLSLPSDI
jgi:hypothetical protein